RRSHRREKRSRPVVRTRASRATSGCGGIGRVGLRRTALGLGAALFLRVLALGGFLLRRRALGRRIFGRGLAPLAARAAAVAGFAIVVDVPAATLEVDRGARHQLARTSAALRADRDRLLVEALFTAELVAAVIAAIFIGGHM